MSYVTKILGYFIKDEEARDLIAQKVSFDIHALTTENAIADADEMPFYDALASAQRKTTWQNVKAKLKGYFDTVYLGAGALTGYATQTWVNAQGFITSLVGYATEVWVQSQGYGTYSKPTGGIPKSDLASAVQESLGKADSALQADDLNGYATETYVNNHHDSTKQDVISDLATIRTNASAGKTASDNLGGHTVGKNVPADAVFTDTVYDDTALKGRVSAIEGKESGWDAKYGADNPPPYPVNSVNGKTGTVTLTASDLGIGSVFTLKGSKATVSALPTTGNTIGDVWYVIDESVGYIWLNDGTENRWEQLGMEVDLSAYRTSAAQDIIDGGKVDKVTGKGLSTNDFTTAYKDAVDANTTARHTHGNKSVLDGITSALVSAWNTASTWVTTNGANVLSHLSDTVKHITAAERTTWNGKQDTISDLATIRSGAALGATALQSVPNTYRTAAAQDEIDNGKEDKSNKVTSISSSSTDTQYPSAKAVYSYIQSLDGNGVEY